MQIRSFFACGLLWAFSGLVLIAAPSSALAQAKNDFPARSVYVVVPYPAGGSLDAVGRPLAQKFQETTGHAMVLENVGGAGGLIGAANVVHARPDGYTLLLASNGQVSVAPYVYKQMPYDPLRDLIPIVHLVDQTAVLYASAKSPYKTLKSILQAAHAKQGRLEFASSGVGSISHLAMALLEQQAGVHFSHIPYRGAAPALQDLAGGQVPLLFTFVGSARPLAQSGMVRPIAVASQHRLAALPNVPTFAELGYPKILASVWIGLMAPRDTPKDRIRRLTAIVGPILQDPSFRQKMAANSMEIKGGSTQDFQSMIQEDSRRWGDLAHTVSLSTK